MTTDPRPLLTYHITLSEQGPFVVCPTLGCRALGAWSPESVSGSSGIDFYLCLSCQQYRIEARFIKDRAVANPATDAMLAQSGDFIYDGYCHLWAEYDALGMTTDVAARVTRSCVNRKRASRTSTACQWAARLGQDKTDAPGDGPAKTETRSL